MATLGTFTAGQVLTAAELNGIGTYQSFTPTFSGFTLGNGTVKAAYTKINKFVHYYGGVTLGSTSSVSGPLDVGLPVTAAEGILYHPSPCYFFNNLNLYWGTCINVSTSGIRLVASNATSTYLYNSDVTGAVPFSWASGHTFFWNHVYRAA